MDVFKLRDSLVKDYEHFTRSFLKISEEYGAQDIQQYLDNIYRSEHFWPEPLIQINPNFVSGGSIDDLVREGLLNKACTEIFKIGKTASQFGNPMILHKHQEQAIRIAQKGESYVLTTGTGSGKSLSYFIPIINEVLEAKKNNIYQDGNITAIVIYPMNALCNSQLDELRKYLQVGFASDSQPVTFGRFTGQEKQDEREIMRKSPPDILLTNFMMLELLMTRQDEVDKSIIRAAKGLKYLVLDELHTYRGRQGSDVALLVRRVREALNTDLICIGTSATMVSEGDVENRLKTVSNVASRLFGANVKSENVITETLQRVTSEQLNADKLSLREAILEGIPERLSIKTLKAHPVAIWIELNMGLDLEASKWVRIKSPKSLKHAAEVLSAATDISETKCRKYLAEFLLKAFETKDDNGKSFFAFRLHQFISGPGELYATIEPSGQRFLTVNGQQYKPGDRNKRLFSTYFCRNCGQEYHPVWINNTNNQAQSVEIREIRDKYKDDEDANFGFLMLDPVGKWDPKQAENNYPEEWIEYKEKDNEYRLKGSYKRYEPIPIKVNTSGLVDPMGYKGWLIKGTFRLCLACKYVSNEQSELYKLTGLSLEGRSSATTVLTLSALKYLLEQAEDLPAKAKKLLGFIDNRQDASLQAGHFNDFINILMLRGALLAAIEQNKDKTLTDESLTQKVFEQLRLTESDYTDKEELRGLAADNARKALCDVLGYRLYYDLRKGWRITNPNLEQLSLLRIDYQYLDDCCSDEELWQTSHSLLKGADESTRKRVCLKLLDTLRRSLSIKTIYLDGNYQEQIRNKSFNELKEPWGLAEGEKLLEGSITFPFQKPAKIRLDDREVFLSYRSKLARELRKQELWQKYYKPDLLSKADEKLYTQIINDLLKILSKYGIVESTEIKSIGTGYRINSSALKWTLPVVNESSATSENEFFRALYINISNLLLNDSRFLHQLEAREHTAQVDSDKREEREDAFREAKLPVLFCSPTMELGVDISELNTVYMRNVPPTPANYAQRSGRAGRSGQPAIVITYCAAKSPHDQYFFADPTRMVAGNVMPPTLDLSNEELIKSHLHSVWLAETGQKLESSAVNLLDLTKTDTLPLWDDLIQFMDKAPITERAIKRALNILLMLQAELTKDKAPWFNETWVERTVSTAFRQFDEAFNRWRTLYKATSLQMEKSHAVNINAAVGPRERQEAQIRYNEARTQRDLLLSVSPSINSDFNTYRYLASQGYLPGYNFPRLPLMAYVPARKEKVARESFLARPRFLAISEFGPQSLIYHEGTKYRVHKAILGIRDEESISASAELVVRSSSLCSKCGYGHFGDEMEFERCIACHSILEGSVRLNSLYRVENVSTRKVTRINSDDEERRRQGYEMQTTIQFAKENGSLQQVKAFIKENDNPLLEVQYGPTATVWRINLGWSRRKQKTIYGFNIDVTTGLWSKDPQAPEESDDSDFKGNNVQRIIPYVEDRRNILVIHPVTTLNDCEMTTLQYALKRGIEKVFQLEESELMVEPLPNRDHRNAILFYESAEGGAGVLTRIASDPKAFRLVAKAALEVCHFIILDDGLQDNIAHSDLDACEAGCYRCLLSYYNQAEHDLIDRKNNTITQLLYQLTTATLEKGTEGRTAEEHYNELDRSLGSTLEKKWLETIKKLGYHLPDQAQYLLSDYQTRPDFVYSKKQALIYIDGPHHETDRRSKLDSQTTNLLEEAGFQVIRFAKETTSWKGIFAAYPDIFGSGGGN